MRQMIMIDVAMLLNNTFWNIIHTNAVVLKSCTGKAAIKESAIDKICTTLESAEIEVTQAYTAFTHCAVSDMRIAKVHRLHFCATETAIIEVAEKEIDLLKTRYNIFQMIRNLCDVTILLSVQTNSFFVNCVKITLDKMSLGKTHAIQQSTHKRQIEQFLLRIAFRLKAAEDNILQNISFKRDVPT